MSGYKPPSGRVTLRFRRDYYRRLARSRGWNTQLEQAEGLGLSQPTVGKILSGKQQPGLDAIAHILRAFPDHDFTDFFEIVPVAADESMRRAS